MVKSISLSQFNQWIAEGKKAKLIDIREAYEYQEGNLTQWNIPMEELMEIAFKWPKDEIFVLYCGSGKRSSAASYMLSRHVGHEHIYSLEGGYEMNAR
jgi:sulfur-carrier protein adenylyltransferase/sulfurtransferase